MKTIDSNRKNLIAAGVLYLLTFVSIPTLALYNSVRDPNYILGSGPDTAILMGNILEIIVALACIGSAVALYPILKKQNEGMALGLVGARVLEAGTIFAGVMFLFTVVTMRQASAGAEALVASHTLITMYDRMFLIGQSFMPVIDDLLLGFLLYQSRLVPRGLSLIGLIGAPLLLVGDISVLFGLIGQRDPLTGLFAIPVALFEFSLGIYLISKGLKSAPTVDENSDEIIQFGRD